MAFKNLLKKEEEPKQNKKSVFSKVKSKTNEKIDNVKDKATTKFVGAVEKEKAISKKLAFWSMVYEVIMMLAYTVMTVIAVFTKWEEANNPLLMVFLLALYVGAFVVMTLYTIKSARDESLSYEQKKATIKNYKSISVIIKKVMKVISVGISILIAIESWKDGLIFQVISIILLAFSILAFFKALFGIFKEVKKMKKRTQPKKQSKLITAKHKVEAYSDSLKEKQEAKKK